MTDEGRKELTRRLATALGSYRAGNRRLDHFYQRYLEGREPGSCCIELAALCTRRLSHSSRIASTGSRQSFVAPGYASCETTRRTSDRQDFRRE